MKKNYKYILTIQRKHNIMPSGYKIIRGIASTFHPHSIITASAQYLARWIKLSFTESQNTHSVKNAHKIIDEQTFAIWNYYNFKDEPIIFSFHLICVCLYRHYKTKTVFNIGEPKLSSYEINSILLLYVDMPFVMLLYEFH